MADDKRNDEAGRLAAADGRMAFDKAADDELSDDEMSDATGGLMFRKTTGSDEDTPADGTAGLP